MPTSNETKIVRVVQNGVVKPGDQLKKTKLPLEVDWQAIAKEKQTASEAKSSE